jgi:DNA helicase-4
MLSQLNLLQTQAVTSLQKRLLVLAGAGSGKTRTLISRILWLIFEKGEKPGNILAITFSKNAANEMLDRLIDYGDETGEYLKKALDPDINVQEKNEFRNKSLRQHPWLEKITVCTFHSLCYKILREYGVHQFDNRFMVITDKPGGRDFPAHVSCNEDTGGVMQKSIVALCSSPSFLLRLKRYILDHYVDVIDPGFSRSTKYEGRYTSLHGEKVKSKSEQSIADWLYRHNIRYIYEPVLNAADFDFHPDFFIPEANLYIEHVSNLSYPMFNKEVQFKKGGKRFVKTFETMTESSAVFNKHLERIVKGRLSISQSFPELNYEEEFNGYHQHVKDFAYDMLQVLDKIKVESIHSSQVFKNARLSPHARVRDFYELAREIIPAYHNYLTDHSYLDFNDLTIQAVAMLENHNEIKTILQDKFNHIMVDEFQDVNTQQVKLLQRLVSGSNHLFCVGDDWQGIYGFRGSDIGYIIDFNTYFPESSTIKLDLNYRSNKTIVDASNEVIRKNKYIVDKELYSHNGSLSKLNIYAADEPGIDDVEYLTRRVEKLKAKGLAASDILVLYRRTKMFEPFKRALAREELTVTARTIHAAKGLEAKVVFILGLTQGYGGFPDIWYNDAIYQVIRKEKYQLMLEEERRLFYVALTRAREEINLLTTRGAESQFIDEIPLRFFSLPDVNVIASIQCPSCSNPVKTGDKFCRNCGSRLNIGEVKPT